MYRYDMHVHTAETSPCGTIPAREVVRLHKEAGYSGIIITDHYYDGFFRKRDGMEWARKAEDYLRGYQQAKKAGDEQGLQVFLGMELRFSGSPTDFLVYGIDEAFVFENPELFSLGLAAFRELILGRDILLFQAHPFRPGMDTPRPELLDGLEVYNGNNCHDSRDHLAEAMVEAHGLLRCAGSDFHEHADLAVSGIYLPKPATDMQDLLCQLRAGTQTIIRPETPLL